MICESRCLHVRWMWRENHSSPGAKRRNRMKEVAVILRCVYPDKWYPSGEFLHHVCAARLPIVNNISSKFNALNQRWLNVGPPSATLNQHRASNGPMYNFRWIILLHSKPLSLCVGVLWHCSITETYRIKPEELYIHICTSPVLIHAEHGSSLDN